MGKHRIALAAASGAAIALAAWAFPPTSLALLLALPYGWSRARTRMEAAALLAGYFFAYAIDVPMAYRAVFPESGLLPGWALLTAHACVLATPWAMLWYRDSRWLEVRMAALAGICILPPFGWLMWGSPFLAAGVFFPGAGASGIVLMAIAAYLVVAGLRQWPALTVLALSSVAANLAYEPPPPPADWIGLQTELGAFPKQGGSAVADTLKSLSHKAAEAIQQGKKVVVLPEEAAGIWTDAREGFWIKASVAAERHGATVLVGADIEADGVSRDALKDLNGGVLTTARLPMPIGNWRPWSDPSIAADPWSFPIHRLHGKSVAFSVCYEDYFIWPHLRLLLDRPDVVVSTANNWMVRGGSAEGRQRASIEATARLVGAPLIRAVNR